MTELLLLLAALFSGAAAAGVWLALVRGEWPARGAAPRVREAESGDEPQEDRALLEGIFNLLTYQAGEKKEEG